MLKFQKKLDNDEFLTRFSGDNHRLALSRLFEVDGRNRGVDGERRVWDRRSIS